MRARSRRRSSIRSQVGTEIFQQTLNREIDILFMIDDSPSMLPLQTKLLANFPVFMNVLKDLPMGLPDVHIAVVSSEHGRRPVRPASVPLSVWRRSRAIPVSADAAPARRRRSMPGQTFLQASNNQTVKNYTGDISDAFTCIAQLGDQGCGFEGQLKSVRWALDPEQHARHQRRVSAARGLPRRHLDHQRGRLLGPRRQHAHRPDADADDRSARAVLVVPLQRVRPPVQHQRDAVAAAARGRDGSAGLRVQRHGDRAG